MKENAVADILWLKKAAEVALDAGIPHFNVRNKKISREFNKKIQRRVNVVEGVIELSKIISLSAELFHLLSKCVQEA